MRDYQHIQLDEPVPFVRRITLNHHERTGADLQAAPHIGAAGASGAELSALVKATQKRT